MVLLQLYTTLGCHLCEEAEKLLQAQGAAVTWETVEISDSQELMDVYGWLIPVVRAVASGDELNWPFDEHQLREWLLWQR